MKKSFFGTSRQGKRFAKKSPGFTLLELMISIVILGIMLLILMGGLRLGYRSVEAGEKKMGALERVRATLNLIDAQIQSEIPLTYEADGERKYYFKGERRSLELSTNYSLWGGEKGYVVVSYEVTGDSQGKKILSAREFTPGREDKKELKLVGGFDDIHFEYFYRDPTEEEGQWVEQWTEDTLLPEKIKLHLISGRKDQSLIIPLRTKGGLVPASPQPAGSVSGKKS